MSGDETTRIIKRKVSNFEETVASNPARNADTQDEEPHTRLFRPGSSAAASGSDQAKANSFTVEPVVGWLVIVDGPGKGEARKLGIGMNSVGRGAEDRISLDFGDEEISRKSHALVTYDPKSNKFFAQHGGGVNLTYLNDQPLLQVQELVGREIISLGNTKLCFVPFCGNEFTW